MLLKVSNSFSLKPFSVFSWVRIFALALFLLCLPHYGSSSPVMKLLKAELADSLVWIVASEDEGLKSLHKLDFSTHRVVLVTGCEETKLIKAFRERASEAPIMVLSSDLMKQDGEFFSDEFQAYGVSHVTALNAGSDFHLTDLSITLRKLAGKKVLNGGVQDYLNKNGSSHYARSWVPSSSHKAEFTERMRDDALSWGVGWRRVDHIFALAEEICSNAIYDAPLEGGMGEVYGKMIHKKGPLVLKPQHWPVCEWACDGDVFVVGVKDYFGALRESCMMEHLQKVRHRPKSFDIMEHKDQGGAGLGFFKMFFSSHALVAHVEKNQSTEIMAFYDLAFCKASHREARSLHFFHFR